MSAKLSLAVIKGVPKHSLGTRNKEGDIMGLLSKLFGKGGQGNQPSSEAAKAASVSSDPQLQAIIEKVQTKLNSSDGNARADALYSLVIPPLSHIIPRKACLSFLVYALTGDEYVLARSTAAKALSRWAAEARSYTIHFPHEDWPLITEDEAQIVVPALNAALEDQWNVASSAAKALGFIGSMARSSVPALIHCLSSDEIVLRSDAAEALRMITGEDFGEAPSGWQNWLSKANT